MVMAAFFLFSGIGLYLLLKPPWVDVRENIPETRPIPESRGVIHS